MLEQGISSSSGRFVSSSSEINFLRDTAHNSARLLTEYQLPNGLIPASLGRFDDEHFGKNVWIKDLGRASRWVLDSHVQHSLPELINNSSRLKKSGQEFYLDAVQAALCIQLQPSQWKRFNTLPSGPISGEYYHLDDRQAPAIKFDHQGRIFFEWGHNQPDNWGTLLLEVGKGIEQDLPILDTHNKNWIPGQVIDRITKYVANLKTERLSCRSIWEHNKAWSSYSTRRIVLAGLEQIGRVYGEIKHDSKVHGYTLESSFSEIMDAAGELSNKALEHFPADFTDSVDHAFPGDLASLVVLNDIKRLPTNEAKIIIANTQDLASIFGFRRYLGDPWKKEYSEAIWTMGIPIMARYHFLQAIQQSNHGNPVEASAHYQQGIHNMRKLTSVRAATKMLTGSEPYIPELFVVSKNNNLITYTPNNNELAWTHGYIIEAAGAGLAASNLLTQRS